MKGNRQEVVQELVLRSPQARRLGTIWPRAESAGDDPDGPVAHVVATETFDRHGDGEADRTARDRESLDVTATATGPSDVPGCEPFPTSKLERVYDNGTRYWTREEELPASPTEIEVCYWSRGVSDRQLEVIDPPEHGQIDVVASTSWNAAIATYTPDRGYAGTDQALLRVPRPGGGVGGNDLYELNLRVRPFIMRAIGDSVTAAFGYYDIPLGEPGFGYPVGSAEDAFDIVKLLQCKPPDPLNDRCSSNSPRLAGSTDPLAWSDDFGLDNNVSWAAQVANANNISLKRTVRYGAGGAKEFLTYANYAVSGAEPKDWVPYRPAEQLSRTLEHEVLAAEPDLTVLTLGANPLLGKFLFEADAIGCKWESQVNNKLRECVQKRIDDVRLNHRLAEVLLPLVTASKNSHVIISLYPYSWPLITIFNESEITLMVDTINDAIVDTVKLVRNHTGDYYGNRIRVVRPPRFNFGTFYPYHDGTPRARCPTGEHDFTDGPSHQAAVQQQQNGAIVCKGDVWVLSNDSGIHPTSEGHRQIAGAAEAAIKDLGLPLPLP